MNKRWNERRPTSIGLVVNYPALGLLSGKAINISQDGMFIETVATSLCNYSDIEITLNLPEFSDKPVQLDATIIHNNNKGIGIMFRDNTVTSPHRENNNGIDVIQQLLAKPELPFHQAC